VDSPSQQKVKEAKMKARLNTFNDDTTKPEVSEKEMCKAY